MKRIVYGVKVIRFLPKGIVETQRDFRDLPELGLTNGGLCVESSPLPVSAGQVPLDHVHTLPTYGCFHAPTAECGRPQNPQSLKYLLPGLLHKGFAEPSSRQGTTLIFYVRK